MAGRWKPRASIIISITHVLRGIDAAARSPAFAFNHNTRSTSARDIHCAVNLHIIGSRRRWVPFLLHSSSTNLELVTDVDEVQIYRDVDQVQSCLCSPAPDSFAVLDAAVSNFIVARSTNTRTNTERTKKDLEEVAAQVVKRGCQVAITFNERYIKPLANVEWYVMEEEEVAAIQQGQENNPSNNTAIYIDSADYTKNKPLTVLDLAYKALQLSLESTKFGVDTSAAIDDIVKKAKTRISLLRGTDLRGRVSADAAITFALAGAQCEELYDSLAEIAIRELPRFGPRASCKPNHILQMAEKFAASGIRGARAREIYKVSSSILKRKGCSEETASTLTDGSYGFFSDMPLLWLWRYSKRQSKVVPSESRKAAQVDWRSVFEDPTRPLVCDLGSGMGVSLLGLATLSKLSTENIDIDEMKSSMNVDWAVCNFVGAELNPTLAGFSSGIANRWGLSDILQYVTIPSEELARCICDTYPGHVKLVMIHNPTPYRLQPVSRDDADADKSALGRNQQSPAETSGFMVSPYLLQKIAHSLKEDQGYLLLSSKSEDVAISMRKDAEDNTPLACVDVTNPVLEASDIDGIATWRTKRAIIQQDGERAIGFGWSRDPLLPRIAMPETEVSCYIDKTPIHRCLLKYRKS